MDLLLDILTIISVVYLYSFITTLLEKNRIKSMIARYTRILNKSMKLPSDKVTVMEFNDRYIINSDIEIMSDLGTIKLFKSEKKLLILDKYFDLTNQQYNDILDLIKPNL